METPFETLKQALHVLTSSGLKLTAASDRKCAKLLASLEAKVRANGDGFMEGDKVESLITPGEFGRVEYIRGCCESDLCKGEGLEIRIEWEPNARIPKPVLWDHCSRTIKLV